MCNEALEVHTNLSLVDLHHLLLLAFGWFWVVILECAILVKRYSVSVNYQFLLDHSANNLYRRSVLIC